MNEDPIIILERKIDTLVERVEQLEREVRVLKEQRASASLGSYSAIGVSLAASSVVGCWRHCFHCLQRLQYFG